MEAVCRGAQAAGGTTVGLLPGLDRAEGNPHLTISVPTGLGQGRNLLLVRSSNALIAVGGGFGTLSEIALALRTGTPVIGLATWSLHLDGRPVDAFPVASDPDTAARLASKPPLHEPGRTTRRSASPARFTAAEQLLLGQVDAPGRCGRVLAPFGG